MEELRVSTGFVQRDTKVRQVAPVVQVPMNVRPPPPPAAAMRERDREEVASLVPAKRSRSMAAVESRTVSTRTAVVRDAALPLDEDHFDIPTFLRRQGQTDL